MPKIVAKKTTEAAKGGAYYSAPPAATDLKRFSSGCGLLDCILGGGWVLGRMENVIGDKSTAKCISGAHILTSRGMELIDTIGATMPYGDTPWEQPLALDSGGLVVTSHFYRGTVDKTVEITTEHGFSLRGTADHPILVIDENADLAMRALSDIRVGDHVVIAPGAQSFPDTYVQLPKETLGAKPPPGRWSGYADSFEDVSLQDIVTEELGSLLGLLVADGTMGNNPRISATKKWVQDEFTRTSRVVFGVTPHCQADGATWSLPARIEPLLSALFGASVSGMTAPKKFVPVAIMRSPKAVQAAFLRALLSCDSSVTTGGLLFTSASERLAKEVRDMLLNFGVAATFTPFQTKLSGWKTSRTYFSLRIAGGRFDVFLKEIGSFKVVSKRKSTKTTSSYLSVPYMQQRLCAEITKVRSALGWQKNGRVKDGRHFPKTGAFARLGMGLTGTSHEYLSDTLMKLSGWLDKEFTDYAQFLISSGYVFEQVTKSVVHRGRQDVFDVHIPDTHLFWSSGFISHNTGLAIEAMANFAMTFPKGKIYYREAEAAFDVPYAERIGLPRKRVMLWEDDHETMFDTVEDMFEDLDKIMLKTNGAPILYVVDSLDALTDRAESKRAIDEPSYGGNKAKQLGQLFRRLVRRLEAANVCLLIISQVRDNIGAMFGEKHTRTGGKAMDFYATHCLWLAHIGILKKTRLKNERAYGVKIKANCKKNKAGQPFQVCEFEYKFNFGIANVESCLNFLKAVGKLHETLGVSDPETFLARIKDYNDDDYRQVSNDLSVVVTDVWHEVDALFAPNRQKYA